MTDERTLKGLMRIITRQSVICMGVMVLAVLASFVPWTYTFNHNGIHHEKPAGYHFIFTPPEPENQLPAFTGQSHTLKLGSGVKIDWPRAIMPMLLVVAATAAGVVVIREKPRTRTSQAESEMDQVG